MCESAHTVLKVILEDRQIENIGIKGNGESPLQISPGKHQLDSRLPAILQKQGQTVSR